MLSLAAASTHHPWNDKANMFVKHRWHALTTLLGLQGASEG